MILELIQSVIAFGILLAVIGLFFYKTYKILRKTPPDTSPWKRVQANVVASQATENFLHGKKGLEVNLVYTVDGTQYSGTGQTVLYAGEQPPTSVELVYKPEAPGAWEWAEDHSELQGTPSQTRFAILFIWLLLILTVIGVIVAVYFPGLLQN